jgi:hypothetical protein
VAGHPERGPIPALDAQLEIGRHAGLQEHLQLLAAEGPVALADQQLDEIRRLQGRRVMAGEALDGRVGPDEAPIEADQPLDTAPRLGRQAKVAIVTAAGRRRPAGRQPPPLRSIRM